MADSVQVLGFWASMYCLRVHYALHLKGVKYENKEQPHEATKAEELLQANPIYKKVPVLIHNGRPICESQIIVDYIENVWPQGHKLLPDDPYERAVARFWADFADKKINEPGARVVSTPSWNLKERSKAVEDIRSSYKVLDEALSKITSESKPFFGGEQVNFADICLAPSLCYFKAFETVGCFTFPSQRECPHLHGYAQAVGQLDFFKTLTPHPDKIVDLALSINKSLSESTPRS